MLQSKLREGFLKDRTEESRCNTKKNETSVYIHYKNLKRTTMKILT